MPSPTERRVILDAVYLRDGGCVAPLIDPTAGACRDSWGFTRPRHFRPILTFDHLRDEPGGFKPCFCVDHLTTICWWHHDAAQSGWATSHRPELRKYHRKFAADAAAASPDSPDTAGGTSTPSATGTTS
jgi:hypothetical protein